MANGKEASETGAGPRLRTGGRRVFTPPECPESTQEGRGEGGSDVRVPLRGSTDSPLPDHREGEVDNSAPSRPVEAQEENRQAPPVPENTSLIDHLMGFTDLEVRVRKLNEETQKINEALMQFKRKLSGINPGVKVQWKRPPTPQNPETAGIIIGYDKFRGKWDLCVQYIETDGTPIFNSVMESPRAIRLYYYKHMGDLLSAINLSVIKLYQRMERATGDTQNVALHSDD